LGLALSDEEVKQITAHIKALADARPLHLADVDDLLREWVENESRFHRGAAVWRRRSSAGPPPTRCDRAIWRWWTWAWP